MIQYHFYKNEQQISSKSRIGKVGERKKRLQELFMPSSNWDGLAEEIAKYCNYAPEIQICFRGRKIDYDDLEYCFKDYKGKTKFTFLCKKTQEEAELSKSLDKFFGKLKEKKLPEFEEKNKDGKNVFDIYEEAKKNIFYISVIATMSSGKSTLINSLLHTDLLPSKNEACTAQITRILDTDGMKEYEATCYGKDKETVIHGPEEITLEKLTEYNNEDAVRYIDITGDIPDISSEKMRLCLRDTPGPNTPRNDGSDKEMTDEIIKETNAIVLYVMNVTQQETNDDKKLLTDISIEMKRTGKRSRDRFIFVLNKCDEIDEEKESLESHLNSAREYLEQFKIEDPILIPTSARLALLIRKNRRGEQLTRKEKIELGYVDGFVKEEKMYYEKRANLTPMVRQKLQEQVKEYHADEDNWDLEALIHTGVPAVQETIAEYVEKYAFPMKVGDALDEVSDIMKDIIQKYELDESVATGKKQLKEIQEQIILARNNSARSGETLRKYQEELESFSLGKELRRNAQNTVAKDLERLSRKYAQGKPIEKSEADAILREFEDELESFQKKLEQDLSRILEEEIFQKGNKMFDQYTDDIREVLSSITIEGYSFNNIRSIKAYTIQNLGDLKEKNTEEKTHTETRWKDNPKRKGFLGKLKFWQSKQISYTVEVSDGKFVNVGKIIVDVMFEFSESVRKNVDDIIDEAEEELKNYVNNFSNNLKGLREIIEQQLDDMEKNMRNEKEIKERVQKNEEKVNWLKDREIELKEIINF